MMNWLPAVAAGFVLIVFMKHRRRKIEARRNALGGQELPPPTAAELYKQLRRRMLVVLVLTSCIGAVYGMTLRGEVGSRLEILQSLTFLVALVFGAGYLVLAWKCPSCKKNLKSKINPAECPYCHANFRN